jgi:hypothetical protein
MTDTTTTTTTSSPQAPSAPWWRVALDKVVPDAREWWLVGLFALAWKLLDMVQQRPDLLKDAAFMTIATLILGGSGIGAASSFLFGGTKTGSEVMSSQQKVIAATATAPALPPDTTTTTTTSADAGKGKTP